MSITYEWRKSQYWNDLDTNGEYFVYTTIPDNTAENIHPNISDTQRSAGGEAISYCDYMKYARAAR